MSGINPISSMVHNLMGSADADRPNRPHLNYPGGVPKLGQQFPEIGQGGPIGQISAIIKDRVEISGAARLLAGPSVESDQPKSAAIADALAGAVALSLLG